MVWHLIKPLLGELSKPFREASLELLKVEKGLKGGAPPWRICVTKTNSVLGFATGSLYIREHAGKNVKKEVRADIAEQEGGGRREEGGGRREEGGGRREEGGGRREMVVCVVVGRG